MLKNLENVKLGLSLINKEEAKMASNFVREITKDPSKKKQGKPPVLREKVFAWLVEAGLLENGYVRGYQIFEIVKDLQLEIKKGDSYEAYEKSKNQACKDVRRQIDVFVNLGLLNKYKNGYTKYNLDRLPNENDKEYKRRCRNTEYGITKMVEWYICLTDKFYNDCDSLGYSYSKRFAVSELKKFDKDGLAFSKLSKASYSSYSFNYKERTTITATGKVTVKTNANEIKNIIEERNEDKIIEQPKEEEIIPEVNIEEPTKEEAVINTIEEDLPDSIEKLDYEIANFRTAIKRGKHGLLGSPERKKAYDRLKALEDKKEELKKNVKKEENVTKVNNKRQIWEKEFKESDYILVSEMMGISNWLKNKYERYSIENDLRLRSYNSAKDFVITEEGETFLGVFKGLLNSNKVLNYNTVKTLLDTTLSSFIEEMIIIEEVEEDQ